MKIRVIAALICAASVCLSVNSANAASAKKGKKAQVICLDNTSGALQVKGKCKATQTQLDVSALQTLVPTATGAEGPQGPKGDSGTTGFVTVTSPDPDVDKTAFGKPNNPIIPGFPYTLGQTAKCSGELVVIGFTCIQGSTSLPVQSIQFAGNEITCNFINTGDTDVVGKFSAKAICAPFPS